MSHSLYASPSAVAPQRLWERPQLLTPPDSRALTTSGGATAQVYEDTRSVDILERICMVAPRDAYVLVIGETGTGQPKGMRCAAVFALHAVLSQLGRIHQQACRGLLGLTGTTSTDRNGHTVRAKHRRQSGKMIFTIGLWTSHLDLQMVHSTNFSLCTA